MIEEYTHLLESADKEEEEQEFDDFHQEIFNKLPTSLKTEIRRMMSSHKKEVKDANSRKSESQNLQSELKQAVEDLTIQLKEQTNELETEKRNFAIYKDQEGQRIKRRTKEITSHKIEELEKEKAKLLKAIESKDIRYKNLESKLKRETNALKKEV